MQIITHPANSHLIEGLVQKAYGEHIHFPLGIPVIFNDLCPIDEHVRWKLVKKNLLTNFLFTRILDLAKPPRWTIRWKIVEEVRAPVFYGFQAQSMSSYGDSYRFYNSKPMGFFKHGPR